MEEIHKKQLNKMLGSKENFYYSLILKGFYLPKYSSSCISYEYLWGIIMKKFYSTNAEKVKIG